MTFPKKCKENDDIGRSANIDNDILETDDKSPDSENDIGLSIPSTSITSRQNLVDLMT